MSASPRQWCASTLLSLSRPPFLLSPLTPVPPLHALPQQALAHPFFDGVDQLIDGGTSSSSAALASPSPYAHASSSSSAPVDKRQTLPADQWEAKVLRHFEEFSSVCFRGTPLESSSSGRALAPYAQLIQQVLSNGGADEPLDLPAALSKALSTRDPALQQLVSRLVNDATQYQLPYEQPQNGGSTTSAAAASSSKENGGGGGDGGGASVESLTTQIAALEAAQKACREANEENSKMKQQLEAVKAARAAGGASEGGMEERVEGRRHSAGVRVEAAPHRHAKRPGLRRTRLRCRSQACSRRIISVR